MAATSTKTKGAQQIGALPLERTARTIGTRLRELRKSQGLTLVQLAKFAGVDAATISRIETGKMTGTLECHIRLATALGVKITDFYAGIEEARTKDAVTVQPSGRGADVYVHEAGKSSIAMLTTDVLRKKLMPVLVTIEPGGSTQKEEAKVGTEKFVYVLDGEVEVKVGDATHPLKRGSALYLDASIPHTMRNTGSKTAKYLSVTTPPVL